MLQDINRKNYSLLYNIDFHSDISDPGLGISEGTWVGYVKWRKRGFFEWRYPDYEDCFEEGWGLCNSDHLPYTDTDPFTHEHLHSWRRIMHREGLRDIVWDRIDRVNICLSDQWTKTEPVRDVLRELKRRGYTKNLSRRGRKFYRDSGLW
jgi:hypothetical protein